VTITMSLPRVERPGKFEGCLELTQKLYSAVMEWGSGDSSKTVADTHHDMIVLGGTPGDSLTAEEEAYLATQAAVIITEDSYGFVYGAYFDSIEDAWTAWDGLGEDDTD
jgi:hypothetical protein